MNGVFVKLTHFQQSEPGYCLPTCARMILAALGLTYTEAQLSGVLGTSEAGTPTYDVVKLSKLKLEIDYRIWSTAQLSVALTNQNPVIAFVKTQFLDHWDSDASHAVVLVGMETGQQFWIHDPALPTGPISVSWDGMLAGWFEFSQRGATIQRKKRFSFFGRKGFIS